jgi:hypothetical protein
VLVTFNFLARRNVIKKRAPVTHESAAPISPRCPPAPERSGLSSIENFTFFLRPVRRHRYKTFVMLQNSHFSAVDVWPNGFTHFKSDDTRQHARQWRAHPRRLVHPLQCVAPKSQAARKHNDGAVSCAHMSAAPVSQQPPNPPTPWSRDLFLL